MDEDYYQYINEAFRKWAYIYDIWTIPIARLRDKVVDFYKCKKWLTIFEHCVIITSRERYADLRSDVNEIGDILLKI